MNYIISRLVDKGMHNEAIHVLRQQKKIEPGKEREYCGKIAKVMEDQLLDRIKNRGSETEIRNVWKGLRRYASRARIEVDPVLSGIYWKARRAHAEERFYGGSTPASRELWEDLNAWNGKKY